MKNTNLFLYIAGVFTLISCGTASHASYSDSKYQNGIYYTPDAAAAYAEAESRKELDNLQGRTKNSFNSSTQRSDFNNKTGVETIYVGDTNLVNISYDPNITYSIVDDDESYEARLRKFDSPTYTVNINLDNNYYPWWDINFGWYRPYGITWGTGWYNPWWGPYYSWYGPRWWNSWYGPGWGNSWYGPGWGWGWNNWYAWNGWYDPWYNPWHGHWNDHWQGHWPAPGPRRDVYYGRRENVSPNGRPVNGRPGVNTGGSYTRRDPNINQIRGNNNNYTGRNPNNTQSVNTGGSIYRRGGSQNHNGAIFNNGASNSGQQNSSGQNYRPPVNSNGGNSQGSMYRRSATKSSSTTYSNSASDRRNNETYRNQSNYNRNNYNSNSSYNRSNYNRSQNTVNSGSSSSYRSNSSGGNTSGSSGTTNSGGSSYRRR